MQETLAFILPLADVSARLSQVGGKGASLARMAAAGLPVPAGFHVTTAAYRRFVTENGLQEQILSAVSAVAAGQQETYLNIHGGAMVLDAVKRCWASLWTARAIGYRARHGIAQEDVSLAVVVQELVPADAAGIMFTANPLTGTRDQVMIVCYQS
jgi:phosphoenolpyruvate synthase/pyruvate phosphate dikinase